MAYLGRLPSARAGPFAPQFLKQRERKTAGWRFAQRHRSDRTIKGVDGNDGLVRLQQEALTAVGGGLVPDQVATWRDRTDPPDRAVPGIRLDRVSDWLPILRCVLRPVVESPFRYSHGADPMRALTPDELGHSSNRPGSIPYRHPRRLSRFLWVLHAGSAASKTATSPHRRSSRLLEAAQAIQRGARRGLG